jgi:hypothetical protein
MDEVTLHWNQQGPEKQKEAAQKSLAALGQNDGGGGGVPLDHAALRKRRLEREIADGARPSSPSAGK